MFDSFENLNPEYVPNNITPCKICDRLLYDDKQYETIDNLLNIYKRQKAVDSGLEFMYEQEISFAFEVDDVAYVERDAIVTYETGEQPDENTQGNLGQRFYNIADLKVWQCKSRGQTVYKWEEDEVFSIPREGQQEVKLDIVRDTIDCVVFNVRGEIVYQTAISGALREIYISKEEASKIIPDLYEFIFLCDGEFRASYNVVITDTRNSFNKDIRHIDKTEHD